ncbi:hypothetical protein NMY22_g16011 [Coprinellus aureogranulatus]|nr:hypothetical protein NMY22_g16011 [Coprinellus aureogranulatus]
MGSVAPDLTAEKLDAKITVKDYDGKRKNFQSFANAVNLYFDFHDAQYKDKDKRKITFILSKLTEGEAELWRRTFMQSEDYKKGEMKYADFWTKFAGAFKKENEADQALFDLHSLKQGTDESAETTITQFRNLASLAGLSLTENHRVAIDYLKNVLKPALVNKVEDRIDEPETFEEWLLQRVKSISEHSPLLKPDVVLRFVIPKFHLPAHIPACRSKFCFMLTRGAGLGDGEAPERGWGESNPLGPATREMGPGTRWDTLDFNFGDYNWRKIINLGSYLLQKLERAASLISEQFIARMELEGTLEPEDIQKWKDAVDAWDNDPSKPNPFEFTVQFPTQTAVRRELSEEESRAMNEGQDFSLSDEISPGGLIAWGLEH